MSVWSVVAVDEVVWTTISGSWRREKERGERGESNGGRRGGIERREERREGRAMEEGEIERREERKRE